MKKFNLDRRTFLRGTGVAIALPALEAMMPSTANAQSVNPKRLMLVYRPHGNHQPNTNDLPTDAIAKVQTADIKSHVNVINRVHHNLGRAMDDIVVNIGGKSYNDLGQGEHGAGISTLFAAQLPGYDQRVVNEKIWLMKKTFDMHIADKFALNAILASGATGQCANAARWIDRYANTMSWRDAEVSLKPYTNPKEIFNLLFGGTTAPTVPAAQQKLVRQKSILDLVMGDVTAYNQKLGAGDKARVDQYLTSLRDVEKRIQSLIGSTPPTAGQCNTGTVNAPDIKTLSQAEYPVRLGIMQDLAVKAFECNRAQIFNLMLSADGDGVNYSAFIPGMSGDGNWHSISHDDPDKQKTAVAWQYEQFKNLCLKLEAVKEADGTSLLYNSAILMMSSISDGLTHRPTDINVILAGNLGGALKTGQQITYGTGNANPPAANVFLTVMRAFGMSDASFGNSTGVIQQLLA